MGEVHVHEFMSLDGVIDAPTWTFDYGFDPQDGGGASARSRGAATASCSGARPTRCSSRPGRRGPWRTIPGRRSSTTPPSTSSRATLTEATWRNSEIIGPYDPDAIRSLKDEVDGDLYVSGSGTLVRAMLADGLVDELHLFVYPLTRGAGPRLFPDGAAPGQARARGERVLRQRRGLPGLPPAGLSRSDRRANAAARVRTCVAIVLAIALPGYALGAARAGRRRGPTARGRGARGRGRRRDGRSPRRGGRPARRAGPG